MTAFERRYFAGGATATTLASAMSSSDTSFDITSDTGWPGAAPDPFFVVIDRDTSSEEKILCSSNSGTTVTVASGGRGADGTSPTSHNISATVEVCITAQDGDEANQVAYLLGNAEAGSLFIGAGSATLPTVLDPGSSDDVLTIVSGTPAWASASGGSVTLDEIVALFTAAGQVIFGTGDATGELEDLLAALKTKFTAAGQLLVGTGSAEAELLATGSSGQVLTVGGSDSSGLEWATPSSGALTSRQFSGTTDTLVIGDANNVVESTGSSAATETIPPNTSVAFPVNTIIELCQYGSGVLTIAAGDGVTLRAPNGAVVATQYGSVSIRQRAADEWVLAGDAS